MERQIETIRETPHWSYSAFNTYLTGINIRICKSQIEWDENEVKLVMMLCFNRNDRYLFNELFEPISMILIDPDNFNEVLKAKTAQEFINILSDKIS